MPTKWTKPKKAETAAKPQAKKAKAKGKGKKEAK